MAMTPCGDPNFSSHLCILHLSATQPVFSPQSLLKCTLSGIAHCPSQGAHCSHELLLPHLCKTNRKARLKIKIKHRIIIDQNTG